MSDRQNLDNFIGDRSSTRVFHKDTHHHSKSSWSLGWGSDVGSQKSVSSNKFANGSNQNAGNVISDRSTTRLHAPPGGHTSDIFGTASPSRVQAPRVTQEPVPMPSYDTGAPVVKKGTSANAFASGSNQNAGNVLTDRPTSRVLAPPGGRSSNIFGTAAPSRAQAPPRVVNQEPATVSAAPSYHDNGPAVRKGTSANAFASGSNQNAGNVLTDRPTSRVLAPPGGRSSNIFGTSSAAPSKPTKTFAHRPSSGEELRSKPAPKATYQTRPAGGGGVSANAFATGSNQNCGNVLTDRPTSRVLAPPGGRSSIFFG